MASLRVGLRDIPAAKRPKTTGTGRKDKKAEMYRKIEEHGKNLLRIFPWATVLDPVALCKRLRKLENRGAAFALRLCNGPEFASEEACERVGEAILNNVDVLLNFRHSKVPVILNRDPRGFALKIDDTYTRERNLTIHKDWGGYGIIAPDFSTE